MKIRDIARQAPRLALLGMLCLASSCSSDSTAEATARAAEDEGPEPVAVTVFTDEVELFMEYPRLVPGLEGRFLAHVTVLATGAPVRTGRLTLELRAVGGALTIFEAPEPARDGLFIPVGSLAEPGAYDARILVKSEQVAATIPLDPIVVHADLASAHQAADAEAEDEPRDAVPFLLEQQWQIGLLLDQARTRTLVRRLQVPGEVEAPQGAAAVLSAPLGGRLVPPPSQPLTRLGDRVERGQVLAFLEPPLSSSDLAQLSANAIGTEALDVELLLRELDLETSALEVEASRFQSLARLEFAQQALARLEPLREKGLGTAAELEAARRDVGLAQRELEGAQRLADSYDQARTRLAGLRDRQPGSQASATQPAPLRIPLVAPISGEIVAADFIEGEHVEAEAAVYRVLDLERAWIKMHVSEFDLHEVEDTSGGLVEFSGRPGRSFDLVRDLAGKRIHVGREVDADARTVALRYEVDNPSGLLRVGMFADVFLETAIAADAVALPREAVVIDGGRPVAFVLLNGELFQKRTLELGVQDGAWVEVLSGVAEGERVATRGAYLVKLAAASPASFGEGHAH